MDVRVIHVKTDQIRFVSRNVANNKKIMKRNGYIIQDLKQEKKPADKPPKKKEPIDAPAELPTKFYELKALAKGKGMTLTNKTKKEEILEYLKNN